MPSVRSSMSSNGAKYLGSSQELESIICRGKSPLIHINDFQWFKWWLIVINDGLMMVNDGS